MMEWWRKKPGPVRRVQAYGISAIAVFGVATIAADIFLQHRLYYALILGPLCIGIPLCTRLMVSRVMARAKAASYMLCPECAYPLDSEDPKRVCSECGRPFDPSRLRSEWVVNSQSR